MDEIYQAPLYKRIIASLLDFVLTVLLAIGLFMLLSNGAVDIGFHNKELKLEQYKLQESSLLFNIVKDQNGNYSEISLLTYNQDNPEEHSRFVNLIHRYYFEFAQGENKSEKTFNTKYLLFNETTLTNGVYKINTIDEGPTSYVLLDEITDVSTGKKVNKSNTKAYNSALASFFTDANKGVYNLAMTEFTSDTRFQSLSGRLANIERLEALICTAFSSLVFLSLPVLINKHGETPFMRILSICFTDSYGYQVKMRHKAIRALTTLLLYASSIYLFGVPIVINAIVMLATQNKRSLIDMASNETAIDRKTSVILEG